MQRADQHEDVDISAQGKSKSLPAYLIRKLSEVHLGADAESDEEEVVPGFMEKQSSAPSLGHASSVSSNSFLYQESINPRLDSRPYVPSARGLDFPALENAEYRGNGWPMMQNQSRARPTILFTVNYIFSLDCP
jgi:hypothetical protein